MRLQDELGGAAGDLERSVMNRAVVTLHKFCGRYLQYLIKIEALNRFLMVHYSFITFNLDYLNTLQRLLLLLNAVLVFIKRENQQLFTSCEE